MRCSKTLPELEESQIPNRKRIATSHTRPNFLDHFSDRPLSFRAVVIVGNLTSFSTLRVWGGDFRTLRRSRIGLVWEFAG